MSIRVSIPSIKVGAGGLSLDSAWSELQRWSRLPLQIWDIAANFGDSSENISITGTSSATGYSLGGIQMPAAIDDICFVFLSAAKVTPPAGGTVHFSLLESGTSRFRMADVTTAGPVSAFAQVFAAEESPTFDVVAWVDSGTGTIKAQQLNQYGDSHFSPVFVAVGKVG